MTNEGKMSAFDCTPISVEITHSYDYRTKAKSGPFDR